MSRRTSGDPGTSGPADHTTEKSPVRPATEPEPFDTFLLLGNNLGLLAGVEHAPRLLGALAGMARPKAVVIGETLDPYRTTNADHLRYHEDNRALGRLPGQTRLADPAPATGDAVVGTTCCAHPRS